MFCRSLRHAGEELLGGVAGYPDYPWTSGIALLHPWANRLGEFRYDGVTLDPDSPDLYVLDGLPLHGLRSAVTGWEVVESSDTRLVAGRELDLREFPFPHRVEVAAELSERALTLTTTVTAHDRPVPIAFGYHPYFKLEREWEIELPVAERIAVDERQIPTGERDARRRPRRPARHAHVRRRLHARGGRRAVRAGRRRAPDRGRVRARLSATRRSSRRRSPTSSASSR